VVDDTVTARLQEKGEGESASAIAEEALLVKRFRGLRVWKKEPKIVKSCAILIKKNTGITGHPSKKMTSRLEVKES